MIEAFQHWNPVVQTLAATLLTWGVTALGAAVVFVVRDLPQKVFDGMLGFAAGVMVAASYWSLLAPAIDMAEESGAPAWVPAASGFLLGGSFIRVVDALLPHVHPLAPMSAAEGLTSSWRRSILLVLAITIHNIPEGLAIGIAFGAAASGHVSGATLGGALALAFGIGIQNFPEGTAVSVPLKREGTKTVKCFGYGQMSGAVEPLAGIVGAAAVLLMRPILPYALSFAAGAMIFVVFEELVPESQNAGNTDFATMGGLLGFVVMMTLDVALG